MFFSLIFHSLQGYFAGFKGRSRYLGLVLATFVMVGGYAVASTIMHGWGAAFPEIFPNFCQNTLGIIVGSILNKLLTDVLKKSNK